MFYPNTQYHEFNDVGTYFAFYKHNLMAKYWRATQKVAQKQSHFRTKGQVLGISQLADVTRIDSIVYSVASGGSLGLLQEILFWEEKRITSKIEVQQQPFWYEWTHYIRTLIEELITLPQLAQTSLLRDDLHYVYNEMFEFISRRIPAHEFKVVVGSATMDDAFSIPSPIQYIDLLPLWTVGQAYETRWTIMSQHGHEGEWTKFLSPQIANGFRFEVFDNECEPEDQEGSFVHDSSSYYNNLLYKIYIPETNREDAIAIANHLIQRIPNAADVHSSIGSKLLYLGDYELGFDHLKEAEKIYLSVLPLDYVGKVFDGNNDYFHFTLLHLGFLHFLKDDSNTAEAYFERAQAATSDSLNFKGIIEQFHDHTDTFEQWYKEELLTYPDLIEL